MYSALRARVGAALACASAMSIVPVAWAEPNDYVHSPIVEEGERELDWKLGSAKLRDGSRESAMSMGLGLGMNAWWSTEIYAKAKRQTPEGWRFDAVEWENRFQLTQTGQYPIDLGLVVELEHPQDRSEGWEVNFGPLFQTELTSSLVANLNLLFTRHYRSTAPSILSMNYQWQLRYRWTPQFEWGAQGFGSLGPWRDWAACSEQEHKAGPAVFGKVRLDAHHAIHYNAAWLFASNANTPRNTARLQVEYEY